MKNQINRKQSMKRYLQEFFPAVFLYVVILIASVTLLKNYELPRIWQIVISMSPALPIALIVIALMRLLIDSDELQQRLNLYAITFSAVLTGLLTFSYGLLENIGLPKMPTFAVFPMLFVLWGIGFGYFTKRYE
jgi:hypothetical protein